MAAELIEKNNAEVIQIQNDVSIIEILRGVTCEKADRKDSSLYQSFKGFIDRAQQTVETYVRNLRQFLIWLEANDNHTPTKRDIINYKDALAVDHKPTTVQCYLNSIKIFYKWLEENKVCENVAKNVHSVKLSRNHKKDNFTPEQMGRILIDIDRTTDTGKRDFAIILLMVSCALRTIEVNRACVGDLSVEGDAPVLRIQGKGKTEKADFVKLEADVEDAIRDYLKTRGKVSDDEPLFTSTSNRSAGQALSTRSISKICKNAFKAAGYDSNRLTAHSLRHTAATTALLAGESLQETQAFMRHANPETTLIYAHNLDRTRSRCGADIVAAIRKGINNTAQAN